MKQGEILKRLLKKRGEALDKVASDIGITRRTLYSLFEQEELSDAYIAKFLSIGVDLKSKEVQSESKQVPYYDVDANAGDVTIFAEDGVEYIKDYISVPAFSDCEMYINVSGNSMYPKYCSGELVALKRVTDLDIIAWGEPHLVVTKEKRLLKYVDRGPDKEHWILKSENPKNGPIDVPRKKVLHLFEVKGKISKNII